MNLKDRSLVERFEGFPALLDANLLLLYLCASLYRGLIGTFKRLNSFSEEDADLLQAALAFFPTLRTTPHVLTEVSNLANSLPRWRRDAWAEHFARGIQTIPEEWILAQEIVKEPAFRLGITDACLCKLASSHVVLTIDFPLSNCLESKKLNVINFNHLRESQFE
jgi:hypothetical protein